MESSFKLTSPAVLSRKKSLFFCPHLRPGNLKWSVILTMAKEIAGNISTPRVASAGPAALVREQSSTAAPRKKKLGEGSLDLSRPMRAQALAVAARGVVIRVPVEPGFRESLELPVSKVMDLRSAGLTRANTASLTEMVSAAVFPASRAASVTRDLRSWRTSTGRVRLQMIRGKRPARSEIP